MKIQTNQKEFKEGIKRIVKAVATKNVLPILFGIHIKTEDGGIVLSATNLEVYLKTRVQCDTFEEGEVVIPAKLLDPYISKLSDKYPVEMEIKDNKAHFKSGNSKFNIAIWNPEEFPQIKENINKNFLSIEQNKLKTMLEKVSYATSTDKFKPQLTGVKLDFTGDGIIVVGTDTYRLSLFNNDTVSELNAGLIIPKSTTDILINQLTEEGTVLISWTDSHMEFDFEDMIVQSRLIAGNYPNYRTVIPKEKNLTVKVDREEFIGAIERAILLKNDSTIRLDIVDDYIKITNAESNVGNIEEIIECVKEGENLTTAVNGNFIIQYLKKVDVDVITIEGNGEMMPVVLIDSKQSKYIVMPVRVH